VSCLSTRSGADAHFKFLCCTFRTFAFPQGPMADMPQERGRKCRKVSAAGVVDPAFLAEESRASHAAAADDDADADADAHKADAVELPVASAGDLDASLADEAAAQEPLDDVIKARIKEVLAACADPRSMTGFTSCFPKWSTKSNVNRTGFTSCFPKCSTKSNAHAHTCILVVVSVLSRARSTRVRM
jgi:hypothetical protein